jgi:hypothetical protein
VIGVVEMERIEEDTCNLFLETFLLFFYFKRRTEKEKKLNIELAK